MRTMCRAALAVTAVAICTGAGAGAAGAAPAPGTVPRIRHHAIPTTSAERPPPLARVVLADAGRGLVAEPPGPLNGPVSVARPGFLPGLTSFLFAHFRVMGAYLRTWTSGDPVGKMEIEAFELDSPQHAAQAFGDVAPQLLQRSPELPVVARFTPAGIPGAIGTTLRAQDAAGTVVGRQVAFGAGPVIAVVLLESFGGRFTPAGADRVALAQYEAVERAFPNAPGGRGTASWVEGMAVVGAAAAVVCVYAFGIRWFRRGRHTRKAMSRGRRRA